MKNILIDAKKTLLKNDNVIGVKYNTDRKILKLDINQCKNYFSISAPLEEYKIEGGDGSYLININHQSYKILKCDYFNTTIYEITLKAI